MISTAEEKIVEDGLLNFSRALVVGGAGFIGSHMVNTLMNLGVEVCVIDNLWSGRRENIDDHLHDKDFSFFKMNVVDADMSYISHTIQPEVIFYLAAIPSVNFSIENPILTNKTNVSGLLKTLQYMRDPSGRKKRRFIFSSSSSVYGGAASLDACNEESNALSPKSPYALQKKIGEEYCKMFSDLYKIDTVSLRYFNVFGPNQHCDSPYASAVSSFCNARKKNKSPIIYGDGTQTRDFCYVENIVYANMLSACYGGSFGGDCFNIGTGNNISINELCRSISDKEPIYKPSRLGDVMNSRADISKAKDVLGYRPLIGLEDGLVKTLDWHESSA